MHVDTSTSEHIRHKNEGNWIIYCLIIFFLIFLAVCGYLFFTLWNALGKGYKSDPTSPYRTAPMALDKPFTLLLMGTDNYDSDKDKLHNPDAFGERTDVLMLIAVHPKKKQALVVNIPRDTIVPIANTNGVRTKINAAYNYAFANLTNKKVDPTQNVIETVSHFLGKIAIDYYAHINFKGFIDLVNAVDGIDVDVPYSFRVRTFDRMCTFQKGPMRLNGECALAYVRQRHHDPTGDRGRNIRQQQVMEELIAKLGSFRSLADISEISSAIGDNLSYDIPPADFLQLAALYKDIPKENIEHFDGGVLGGTKAGNTVRVGKTDYVVIPAADKRRLYDRLVEIGIPHGPKPNFITYTKPSSGK